MRIQSITNYNTAFKGYSRTVYKPGKELIEANVLHKNNTSMFREDLNIKSFLKFITKKFENVDKVHFFDYACSNGSEAYSLLLGMNAYYDKNEITKFLPIQARDYDQEVINTALKKELEISDSERYGMDEDVFQVFKKNFNKLDLYKNDYIVSDELFSQVNFAVSDITKDYVNLPKENVILCIRNCWPYFSKEDQLYLPEKLCNHFDKNAVILIGSFDHRTQQNKAFLKNGFKKAYIKTNGAAFVK